MIAPVLSVSKHDLDRNAGLNAMQLANRYEEAGDLDQVGR